MKTCRLAAAGLVLFAFGCAAPYGAADEPAPPSTSLPNAGCDPRGTYRFCDDFDHRTEVDDGRWRASVGGTGVVSIDSVESSSRPAAALSSVGPGKASTAALVKVLALTGSKARTEADLRLDAQVERVRSGAMLFGVGLPSGEHAAIGIVAGRVVLQLGNAAGVVRQVPLDPFPLGAWTHVVLEIAFDAQDGRVLVSADDKVLFDERRLELLGPSSSPATFQLVAGVSGSPEVPVSLRLDNVKVF